MLQEQEETLDKCQRIRLPTRGRDRHTLVFAQRPCCPWLVISYNTRSKDWEDCNRMTVSHNQEKKAREFSSTERGFRTDIAIKKHAFFPAVGSQRIAAARLLSFHISLLFVTFFSQSVLS